MRACRLRRPTVVRRGCSCRISIFGKARNGSGNCASWNRIKSLLLHVADWQGHLPGQHLDIRLTAEDGYQAQRSYSIGSPPEDELLTLTVERVENGEVSPYLVDELRTGDRFELRGPLGGYF